LTIYDDVATLRRLPLMRGESSGRGDPDPSKGHRSVQGDLRSILSDNCSELPASTRLCAACSELLPISDAAISVRAAVDFCGFVCASDPVIQTVEELQLSTGEGPSIAAVAAQRAVLVADLGDGAQAARWPTFTADALQAGISAVFAFPLHIGALRMGSLGLYRDRPGALNLPDVADALAVVDAVGLALMAQWELADPDESEVSWWGAISRLSQ
jgi:hypothetical protein